MPIIEHRRHAMRRLPDGVHLIQSGVDLARRVGAAMGSFDRVITSEVPRAFEIAIAMGHAVDEQVALLGSLEGADGEIDWAAGCAAYAEVYRQGGRLNLAAQVHAGFLRSTAASLAEDGRALLISHGGIIELGVVGLLPEYDYAGWGPSCSYCEGVRLYFESDRCVRAELLRIDDFVQSR